MDPVRREQLTQNKNKLVHLIDFDVLRPKLKDNGIFTDDMLDNIYSTGLTLLDRNDRLIDSLPKRGPEAYDKFVKCLVDSGQLPAAQILYPDIPDAGKWTGSVIPATQAVLDDNLAYPMHSKPRGVALVISNTVFDKNNLGKRIGGEIDEENLRRLFAYLGFEVDLHQNKSAQDIETIVENFRNDPRHQKADACIVVVLSHGSSRGFYGSDGIEIGNESIIEKFNNVKCPLLRGKPKVFFLQFCRGDAHDMAIRQRRYEPTFPDAGIEVPQNPFEPSVVEEPSLAAWSDVMICYSTSPKYISLRSPESGTWFIRTLVDVFSERAHNTHLENMLREITNRMLKFESCSGWKQSPGNDTRGWRRKLYFNPGIYS